jgi:hypothetical protein
MLDILLQPLIFEDEFRDLHRQRLVVRKQQCMLLLLNPHLVDQVESSGLLVLLHLCLSEPFVGFD